MTFAVWQKYITDEAGNVLPSTSIEVRRASDNALAVIFEDRDGTIQIVQPGASTDANGLFRFYVAPGRYRIIADPGGPDETAFEDINIGTLHGIDQPQDNAVIYYDGENNIWVRTLMSLSSIFGRSTSGPPKSLTPSQARGVMSVYSQAEVDAAVNAASATGMVAFWAGDTPPTGWLEHDGAAIRMTDYPNLHAVRNAEYGLGAGTSFTADDTTDTITSTAHGLSDGDILRLTNSGGALPGGLAADTDYYVIQATADTFKVSTAQGGAAIDITSTGTGTHSWHDTFLLPDDRGRFIRAWDNGAGVDPDAASRTDRGDGTTGDNVGTLQDHALETHTGEFAIPGGCATGNTIFNEAGVFSDAGSGSSTSAMEQGACGSRSGDKAGFSMGSSTETRPNNRGYMVITRHG